MPYRTRFYRMPVGEDGKRHKVWVNLNDYSMVSILGRAMARLLSEAAMHGKATMTASEVKELKGKSSAENGRS